MNFFFSCYFSKSDHIAHYKANDPNSRNKLRTKMNECSIFVWPNNGTAAVFGIFNVHADVDACDCTRWLYGHHKRVCTESSLWKENLLPHLGTKTHVNTVPVFSVGCSTNRAIHCPSRSKTVRLRVDFTFASNSMGVLLVSVLLSAFGSCGT